MTRPGLVVVSYASSRMVEQSLPVDVGDHFDVVLVDNFSTDDERQQATSIAEQHGWQLIARPNDGFGGGVNAGCRHAIERGSEQLVLLNPDAIATTGALLALVDAVRRDPRTLVAPGIKTSDGRWYFRGSVLDLRTGHLRGGWNTQGDRQLVNWLTGACLAFSSQVFETLGGFDDSLFLYWEDVDFSHRAQAAGFGVRVLDEVLVVHDEGGTQTGARPSQAKSDGYYYWNCRNRLAFAASHLPAGTVGEWVRATPRESTAIWMRGGRRQAVEHPAGVWAAVRGTAAGLRLALPRVAGRRAA